MKGRQISKRKGCDTMYETFLYGPFGWDGTIRTCVGGFKAHSLYRLATSQYIHLIGVSVL